MDTPQTEYSVMAPDAATRLGIIGCDTSHVSAFAKVFCDPSHAQHIPGFTVAGCYPSFSEDVESSRSRVDKFRAELEAMGIPMCDSIETLLADVDAVLLENVDGRQHLPQARPVFAAGKPVFIDKPFAASLADARELVRLARESRTPCFTASALRFDRNLQAFLADADRGEVIGVDVHSPASLEPTNPGLLWYGIHGVEMLYEIMGTGCRNVGCVSTPDCDVAVGTWADGRIGVMRGTRKGQHGYGFTAYCDKKICQVTHCREGVLYVPMLQRVAAMFKGEAPPAVELDNSLEAIAFCDAALRSSRDGGRPAAIEV